MADKKPDKKSEKAPVSKTHPIEPVVVMFLVAALLSAIVFRFDRFLGSGKVFADFLNTFWLFAKGEATFAEVIGATGSPFVADLILFLKVFSITFSVFMVWMIISTLRKSKAVRRELFAPLHPPHGHGAHGEHGGVLHGVGHASDGPVNPKWVKVQEHINSPNPSDWKLAILEADIMLNEMLEKMSYHGATIGDKLKSIEPSDFDTLDEAWEAHKIRNSIAHEGSDYAINKPEAERVIKLFKKVFEEFKFI